MSANRCAVEVYNLDGTFNREFRSIKECSDWLNIDNKHLESTLYRKGKRIKGFQIIKKGWDKPGIYSSKKPNPKMFKPLYLKDINTNEIIKFNSRKELNSKFGITSSVILWYINKNKVFRDKYFIIDGESKEI